VRVLVAEDVPEEAAMKRMVREREDPQSHSRNAVARGKGDVGDDRRETQDVIATP